MMANQSKPTRNYDYLRIVIDDGSGRLKVAGQLVPAGAIPSDLETDVVQIQEGCDTLDHKFLIVKDANGKLKLLQGEAQISDHLADHPEGEHRVIENGKFAFFFDQYKDHPAVRRFFKSFGDFGSKHGDLAVLQSFTTWRYRTILAGVLDYYKHRTAKGLGKAPGYWDTIQIETLITVPALWSGKARSILMNAATDTGFSNINLRLEPLCAAALNMQKLLKENIIRDGMVLAFVETGHLTNDRAAVRYTMSSDHQPHLEIVGQADGDACGSHHINHLACEYARSCDEVQERGGLKEVLRRLGDLPEEAFDRAISPDIDVRRERPPTDFVISVQATAAYREVDQGLPTISIAIRRGRMQRFLDQWAKKVVDQNIKWLKDLFRNNPTLAVSGLLVTGGGGSNKTLQKARIEQLSALVKHIYHNHTNRTHEVAEGGTRQYPTNQASELRYGDFYIARDYPVRAKHQKKTKSSVKRKRKGRVALSSPASSNTQETAYESKGYLIMRRLFNKPVTTNCVPMRFEVDAEYNVDLELLLYYTQVRFPNGVPLLDRDGELRPEFKEESIQFAIVDVDWNKYEGKLEMYQRDGKDWYDITGFIQMAASNDHIDLKITLLEPGEELKYDRHQNVKTDVKYRKLYTTTREFWDVNRSSYIPNDMSAPVEGDSSQLSCHTGLRSRNPRTQLSRITDHSTGDRRSRRARTSITSSYRSSFAPKCGESHGNCDSDVDDDEPLPPGMEAKFALDRDRDSDEDIVVASPSGTIRQGNGAQAANMATTPRSAHNARQRELAQRALAQSDATAAAAAGSPPPPRMPGRW